MVKMKTMKKHILILSLLLGASATLTAQMSQYDNNKKESVAIGIKGGLNIPQMWYIGNKPLSRLDQKMNFTPTGGLFVEIPIGRSLIIAPEAMYVQRGTDMSYEHRTGSQVHYTMSASYVDLRLPLELKWPISKYIQPYLVVGAEGGMRLFGQIHMDRTAPIVMDETIDVGDANLALIHAGGFAGVGLRSTVNIGSMELLLKLSVTAHQGLLDSYAAGEKEGTSTPVNVNAYQIKGSRLPQGLEACLSIGIPLKAREDDACATFSKDRYRRHSRGSLFGF